MAHWRDSYRPARFFFLDAYAGVAVLGVLIHIRPWTMALAAFAIAALWWIERIGLGFRGAMRSIRAGLAGDMRPALPNHKVRHKIDFGRRRVAWEDEAPTGEHRIVLPAADSSARKNA